MTTHISGARTGDDPDIVTKLSERSVSETVALLTSLLAAQDIKLFAVIDYPPRRATRVSSCATPPWSSSAARSRGHR
jgi:hypothetical protein